MEKKISNGVKLIIVESPTKAKTISNFLGKSFKVESSYGHIRDLPKSKLGVDVENNFEPSYIIPTKARRTINNLKRDSKSAEEIILATDEDREGEAIAWHLGQALQLRDPKRIVFHEITKSAIEGALENPRDIDMNLVDAQQARRVLDRLVGYQLSPFLWKKIFRGLSAGRVQSVAVRLVVDQEREIEKFVSREYWSIAALFLKNKQFEAILVKQDGETLDKFAIKTKNEAEIIVKQLDGAEYQVKSTERKEIKKLPKPPLTTSTLQQEAWQRFRFPAKITMQIAQRLYEKGYTTYHRTDSLNLSQSSLSAAKEFIIKNYGEKYWAGFFRKYKTKSKGAQEAHEAIRPSYPEKTPEKLKIELDKNQLKLYDLIWGRFIASQMKEAVFDSTIVDIDAHIYTFRASGQILKFDGFLKVYSIKFEEVELPELEKGEILNLQKLIPSQHFTEPPPRYTEATLIKALEKNGIGRPSTYAPIITTIQERNYIKKNEQKRFIPTKTGIIVNDLLVEHFPEIVNIQFTSKMEKDLDKIAEGETKWRPIIKDFYEPFSKNLEKKYQEVEKRETEKKTDEVCDKCGKPMVIREGRFGEFLACSGFPKCKNTKSLKTQKENEK